MQDNMLHVRHMNREWVSDYQKLTQTMKTNDGVITQEFHSSTRQAMLEAMNKLRHEKAKHNLLPS